MATGRKLRARYRRRRALRSGPSAQPAGTVAAAEAEHEGHQQEHARVAEEVEASASRRALAIQLVDRAVERLEDRRDGVSQAKSEGGIGDQHRAAPGLAHRPGRSSAARYVRPRRLWRGRRGLFHRLGLGAFGEGGLAGEGEVAVFRLRRLGERALQLGRSRPRAAGCVASSTTTCARALPGNGGWMSAPAAQARRERHCRHGTATVVSSGPRRQVQFRAGGAEPRRAAAASRVRARPRIDRASGSHLATIWVGGARMAFQVLH